MQTENKQLIPATMEDNELEDIIARELCDVLDEPEAYLDCVLAINRKTHEVVIAAPASLTKEFDTYPIWNGYHRPTRYSLSTFSRFGLTG